MAAEPTHVERLAADALACHARGDLDAAAMRYEALLADAPTSAFLVKHFALVRLQQKRLDEAWALFEQAIGIDPSDAELIAWKAEVLRQRGDARPAIDSFVAALRARPDFAPALFNLGLAHMDIGEAAAAHHAWVRFLELRPKDARVRRELGHVAVLRGDLEGAVAWHVEQLKLFPQDHQALYGLASTLLQKRETRQAIGLLEEHLAVFPQSARALTLLAKAMSDEGRLDEARDIALRAVVIAPDDVHALRQTAWAFERLGRLEDAIAWFSRAAFLAPKDADIQNSLAVAHLNLADPTLAITHFRRALELRPTFKEAHSNLLMALHHVPNADPQALVTEHVKWAELHANVPVISAQRLRSARIVSRRLRIGYCSPRFCAGPLERFITPVLRAHDRRDFEITCFAFSDVYDEATRTMMESADAWQWCAALNDAALVDLMRQSEIDILVDLVGHCPGNRLGAFARRGAPVQMAWMDYVDTTGLRTMDYFVTDARHTPTGGTQRFTEALVQVSGTRFCYCPADDLPAVRANLRAGSAVTFGCFNRLSKITGRTVELWSRVLRNVPDSRLLLKAAAFASEQTRDGVKRRFLQHGIEADRLDLRRTTPEREMLGEYNEVDIVLDPLPYSGCTTTCDALSMGVPVVTREGFHFAGRHATSLLTAAGFAQWIARSDEAFVKLATEMAVSAVEGEFNRERNRAQFLASPVCNAREFAGKLERLYRECWTTFCRQSDTY